MENVKPTTRLILEAALFIVIARILDSIEFRIWPQGGSVDLAMVPLVIYAVRHGVKWGVLVGMAYGILSILWIGGMYHPLSGLLDYVLADGAMGLAGIFKGAWRAYWGVLLGGTVAFALHIVSGVVVFAHYMPAVYFGMNMTSAWLYSLLYNGSYMIPSMILSIFVLLLLHKPLKRYIMGEDLNR